MTDGGKDDVHRVVISGGFDAQPAVREWNFLMSRPSTFLFIGDGQ